MKKRLVIILSCAAALVVALAAAVYFCSPLKLAVKDVVNRVLPGVFRHQIYYQNNEIETDWRNVDFDKNDVKEFQVGNNHKYFINHCRGYAMTLPRDAQPDFTAGQEFIKFTTEKYNLTVSKEFSTLENAREFVDTYLNKYILNENYQEKNKVTVHENRVVKTGKYWTQVLAYSRMPAPMSNITQNTYVSCSIFMGDQHFYRLLFKAERYDEQLMHDVYDVLYSFTADVPIRGVSNMYTDYKPVIPENWSEETKAVYEKIASLEKPAWGAFIPQGVRDLKASEYERLERELDYSLAAELEYIYYWEDFPAEGMEKAYENGKIVELTMQVATVMNEDLDGDNPFFAALDGVYDDMFRKFARDAKAFGKPFIFRLNNEMNSDWTSYGGPVILNDPELFVSLWRHVYEIFEQEGVNNAIWVFNPNGQSFPPCGFNSAFAYYPGNEYVQLFGVTGYNTGDYYADVFGERWRSFEDIYDEIYNTYKDYFDKFPWMITEFACASEGGDKPAWIYDMFEKLGKYPEIKLAVWFNSADLDFRFDKSENKVARAYWLDETPQTLAAFKKGLADFGYKPVRLIK